MKAPDLEPADAAKYLRVPEDTLRHWRYKRKGPKYRKLPSGKITYPQADLDAFLASCIVDPRAA